MSESSATNQSENRDPRVYLAAERTMLAWLRTGIAMMGFGFVVARFGLFLREIAAARTDQAVHPPGFSLWVGTALVLVGVWVNLSATITHSRFRKRFLKGEPFEVPKPHLTTILAILLAIIGITMTVYLFILERR